MRQKAHLIQNFHMLIVFNLSYSFLFIILYNKKDYQIYLFILMIMKIDILIDLENK